MAREIRIPYPTGSSDLYLRFFNAAGQYRRGDNGVYEAFNAASIALYGADAGSGTPYHVAAEDGTTGAYFADLPDSTARSYGVYRQAGASPVQGDIEVAAGDVATFQTGDSYAYLGTNLGAAGVAATEAGGTGDHLTAVATAANQTTILNRLGAWTGTGINTILGGIRALAAKAAALTPTDISSGTTYDNTTDSLEANRDNIGTAGAGLTAVITSAGTGARTVAITVNDGTTALESARVRVTKGAESYALSTSAAGLATFNLDDGTWTVAITLAGYTYSGTTIVVDGNETVAYSMTAASFTPSTRPDTVTLRYTVIDDADYLPCGAGEGTVQIRMKTAPTDDGFAWGKDARTATTDANGVVQFAEVPIGCTLLAKLGAGTSGEWTEVTIPASATSPYDGGEILGTVP